MTPAAPSHGEFAPIFDWRGIAERRLPLMGFIGGSALLHALCFYLFQITYPPATSLLPAPARVNIITGETEEGRVLLRWLEAEDPALAGTTLPPPDSPHLQLPRVAHVPSYANHRPAPKDLPPHRPDLRVPSAQPPGPVRLPRRRDAPAPPSRTATTFSFTDAEILGAADLPELRFSTTGKEAPRPAEFRLAIDRFGAVRYRMLEQSSGDAALDEQARQHLLLCRFPAFRNRGLNNEQSMFWTRATITWGNDIAPQPSTVPAQPAGASKP
jgi:hypothetical protein